MDARRGALHGVKFLTHITRIFQALDRTMFNVFSKLVEYKRPFDNVAEADHNFQNTRIVPNTRNTFHIVELEFDIESEPRRFVGSASCCMVWVDQQAWINTISHIEFIQE
jgi:hypothetical protein